MKMRSLIIVLAALISVRALAQMPIQPPPPTPAQNAQPNPSTSMPAATPGAATATAPGPTPAAGAAPNASTFDIKFLEKYPHLRDNIYQEPESHFYLGLSAGGGLVQSRMYFSANFFQAHYITDTWDLELFTTTYGQTTAQPSYAQSHNFIFRTVPKWRWNDFWSIGILVGYEFVSFPNVSATIYRNTQETLPEPFSSSGWIYGVAVAENIKLESGTKLRLSEVVYQETYSNKDAGKGWVYLYGNPALNADPDPIAAGVVLSVELGFLF